VAALQSGSLTEKFDAKTPRFTDDHTHFCIRGYCRLVLGCHKNSAAYSCKNYHIL